MKKERRRLTFPEAIAYAECRKVLRAGRTGTGEVLIFDDRTALESESFWSGPYSDITPDIDALSPAFILYTAVTSADFSNGENE